MKGMTGVPFYANTDNSHCFQACFKMALEYFKPDQAFTFEELDVLSDKPPGMPTWPTTMLVRLKEMGLTVKMIEGFDFRAFMRDGEGYIRKAVGGQAAEWQISHSNIPKEQQAYRDALDAGVEIDYRVPDYQDIQRELVGNTLAILSLNSARLNGQEGYVGHAVLIHTADDQSVVMHNPGPPPQESQLVSKEDLLAAWSDPNETSRTLILIGKDNK